MELDELKKTWQALGQRLERQEAIQLQLLRESKLGGVRSHLRPLFWGLLLQLMLGIGITALGVACWTRNLDVAGLLVTGILLHAFGVVSAVMAGMIMVLAATIDYAAPVLRIQKRMALLLRMQVLNSNVCGLPWWIMWLLVVVAFAALGDAAPSARTPAWISISLAISVAGLLGTWYWAFRSQRRGRVAPQGEGCNVADGADGIRRGQRLLDDIARFERE